MTHTEALKLALELAEDTRRWGAAPEAKKAIQTITAIKEALAQPEQEQISDAQRIALIAYGAHEPAQCKQAPADATKIAAHILTYLGFSQDESVHPGADRRRDTVAMMIENAVPQPAQQEPVARPIETNNQVEALAKQCGWNNRRYMTPADYQFWCDRMRQFVQLASPPAQRTWVGLTESEKSAVLYDKEGTTLDYEDYADAIEAKLKEKNT